jgi:hypothetical protein
MWNWIKQNGLRWGLLLVAIITSLVFATIGFAGNASPFTAGMGWMLIVMYAFLLFGKDYERKLLQETIDWYRKIVDEGLVKIKAVETEVKKVV